jgi:tetratricopeptide (TPR) repeat protein
MKVRRTFLWSAVLLGTLGIGAGGWLFARDLPLPPVPPADVVADGPLPIPPVPPRLAEGQDYEHCLDMLTDDPAGANAFAEAWQATGGGDGALHCLGLAQIALGDPDSGAAVLERVAQSSRAPALARAVVFGQAAQAWLMAGDAAHAYAASTLALSLSPDDADLLVDRSVAAATMEHYADAIADLDHALLIDPKRDDALVFRGAAYRQMAKIDMASNDIDRALLLDPDNADALLERGILRQLQGNRDGARADWERAVAIAPDTATGDLAQQNLALLEAGPSTQ